MINPGSLVLYKNQAGLVRSVSEGKLSVEMAKGEEPRRLREKDVVLIHPGPMASMPVPSAEGDFATAFEMLFGDPGDTRSTGAQGEGKELGTGWMELAELVFGEFTPSTALACVQEAQKEQFFRILDGKPAGIPRTEREARRAKEEEKLREARDREEFVRGFRKALKEGSQFPPSPAHARLVVELENLALGLAEKSPLAREIGIGEQAEQAHRALVEAGIWEKRFNPWPLRVGCALKPPKSSFPLREIPGDQERVDMRRQRSFAIDNPWSKDPDDAIAYEDGRIWVHVADPAAFVEPDSDVDREALSRGATLYLPEKIIPMLPESALPILGLGLSSPSPALSFGILLGEDGHIEDAIVTPSVVEVARLSYAQADELLSSGDPVLAALDEAARRRKLRRSLNGAVDIELPEVSIKADEREIRFVHVERTRSAEIVKECMLLASEAAGRWAWSRGIPVPYSSQEAPQLPKGLSATDEGEPLPSVQYQRRRGMKASVVGPECLAHQGLGLSFYCQVTSPLRRYQDLLAHHQIRAGLGGRKVLSSEEVSRRCLLANQAAGMTRQAERDSRQHWIAVFLAENPGWTGEAIVLDARERECLVLLPGLGLETTVKTRIPCEPDQRLMLRAVRSDIAAKEMYFELL